MEQNQSSNQQPPQAPQATTAPLPDPSQYDFYEPTEVARFHHDNSMYMQSQIDARMNAHRATLENERLGEMVKADLARTEAKFGKDENFQQGLEMAVRSIMDGTGKFGSIEDAYASVTNPDNARPGEHNTNLPKSHRNIKSLGQIIQYNHDVGRSRPFAKKRGW